MAMAIGGAILGVFMLLSVNGRKVRKMERMKGRVNDLRRANDVYRRAAGVERVRDPADLKYRD